VPLIAANLVQQALGVPDNALVLFDDDGRHELARAPKLELARQLVAHIARSYAKAKAAGTARRAQRGETVP